MGTPVAVERPTLLAVIGASAAARRSLDHVATIAVGLAGQVRLVVTGAGGEAPDGIGWTADRVAEYATERLRRAEVPIAVELVVRAHLPRLAALARDADLVIVGRDGEADRLAEQLMAAVDAPILVVRDGPGRFSAAYRVLLAVRDVQDVAPAVAAVARLVRAVPVEALVVHVPEIRSAPFGGFIELTADDAVAAAVRRLRSLGVPAEGRTVTPSLEPADALRWVAEQWDATVVVINSRRASGFLARFMASTAREMIRHGSRPVLITARG